jgi:GTP pyrophosphokinase
VTADDRRTVLGERFADAMAYALDLHRDQRRKASGDPYVAHLLAVASLVLEDGGSEDEAIAALLHDAVEDQGGARVRAEIAARFGAHVATIVDGCSDAETVPKPPWRQRKEAFLSSLQTALPEVIRVSAADKLHNVRSLLRAYRVHGEALWDAFRGGREGTLWYQTAVAAAIGARSQGWLAAELARAVTELLELAGSGQ